MAKKKRVKKAKGSTKRSEAELAAKVIEFLEGYGWDVYPEVEIRSYIADIVAVKDGKVWIVEVKKGLALTLLAQAQHWSGRVHFVSVAYEAVKTLNRGHDFAKDWLRTHGIGALGLYDPAYDRVVYEWWKPTENARPMESKSIIEKRLHEKQKEFTAGAQSGKRWTRFKQTCEDVKRVVAENPGIKTTDLVKKIDHHYATNHSARSSLNEWGVKGKIEGCRVELKGRITHWYPDD